jgi:hypothetical protein
LQSIARQRNTFWPYERLALPLLGPMGRSLMCAGGAGAASGPSRTCLLDGLACGLLVDAGAEDSAGGDLRQQFVGCLLLVEGLTQRVCCLV